MDLEGKKPAPPPLYIVGRRMGAIDEVLAQPSPSPKYSSSPVVLGEALQDCHAPPPPPRRCAATGRSLPQPLLPPLLDQEGGDVIRSVCVLNAEVLSVRHLVIDDLNHGEYDSIITLQASACDLQVVCRCKLTPLTRCLDELID